MSSRPILIPDTSGLNHLARDPECPALLAGITAGYFPRITSTNLEEIAATTKAGQKRQLLDVCQGLQAKGECIMAYQDIISGMIRYFDGASHFDWRYLPIRFREAEREIVRREITCDPELAEQQDAELKHEDKVFTGIFTDARPYFEEIFQHQGERLASYETLIEALQTGKDGAFWAIAADLYMRASGKEVDDRTIRNFVDACPPFKALLLAIFVAQYEYSIRDLRVGTSLRAGRVDLYCATYVPYCDLFVTADERQYNALAEIVSVGKLTTEIVLYKNFRERLLPEFWMPDAEVGAGAS